MAGRALDRMPIDAADIAVRRQQFVPLTIASIGNAGTATDGFDSLIAPALAATENEAALTSSMDSELTAATFKEGELVPAVFGQAALEYQQFTGAGESVLQEATPVVSPGTAPAGSFPNLCTFEQLKAQIMAYYEKLGTPVTPEKALALAQSYTGFAPEDRVPDGPHFICNYPLRHPGTTDAGHITGKESTG